MPDTPEGVSLPDPLPSKVFLTAIASNVVFWGEFWAVGLLDGAGISCGFTHQKGYVAAQRGM